MYNFTTDDLVLYLHNQLPAQLAVALQLRLITDWALREKLSVLKQSDVLFQDLRLKKPRAKAVQAIMQYVMQKEKV